MEYNIYLFMQSLFLLAITPLFSGILKKIKAFLRGYEGPSVFQVYYDIFKLFQKGRVISKSSSFITQIAPVLCFATAVAVTFMLPVFYAPLRNSVGNLFIIIFMLGIIKFLNALIGLDCCSTFGGMGSSRELFLSMLAEPILFVSIAFLYLQTSSLNIFNISLLNNTMGNYNIGHILAAVSFFIVMITENARMPIDNPETHLELTMIHEAMILDLSGSDLAWIELSAHIKFMSFLTIFINAFVPYGIAVDTTSHALIFGIVLYILKMLGCLMVIGVLETSIAKSRLFRAPELLSWAFSVGIAALTINYFL